MHHAVLGKASRQPQNLGYLKIYIYIYIGECVCDLDTIFTDASLVSLSYADSTLNLNCFIYAAEEWVKCVFYYTHITLGISSDSLGQAYH